ncbi:hypothetical protein VIBNISFn27_1170028 [Vibrio nigripulchritudo SFn27]|nr:hypothetical protein VIBNISFn27_1170028 [Vibrio nigripulchritudo SFn27]CCO38633.1 hypothetical protein VIBNISFn135_1050061 [Vibrio nigripulchritudo SFn135]
MPRYATHIRLEMFRMNTCPFECFAWGLGSDDLAYPWQS